jgi:hypothetical protein
MKVKRELELLNASPDERAALLKQPPRRPTGAQLGALKIMVKGGGAAPVRGIHYRTGLVLTARRWARLADTGDDLVFRITEAGRDVLARYGKS